MNRAKKPSLALAILACFAVPLAAQRPRTPEPAAQRPPELWLLSDVIRNASRRVAPAVVTVETFGGHRKVVSGRRSPPGAPKPPKPLPKKDGGKKKPLGPIRMPGFIQAQGASTGLVVSEDGWILTSRFVLSFSAPTILVTLADGRKFTAEVKGEDETRGLALLKVDATGLPVPEICKRDDMKVGQWAFALGRSFGPKEPTVHAGIVSALDRIQGRAVQCDANTSPANYGGPLVDIRGRVLGLVTPLSPQGDTAGVDWYDSGIGFAATLDGIEPLLAEMKKGKVIRKGLLGIRFDPSELGPGASILSVLRKSPAYHAALRKGDRIVEVDGVGVRHSMHLQDLIGRHVAGDLVTIVVEKKRGGRVEILVELEERKG